ncbi:MAG: acetyl ornithine aminotransferase family protein [candidate division WOR-3 bacterium]
MQKPKIITKLPGPKAQKILRKDKKYISPSYTRSYPAVIERGEGCWVWDVDGNKFLDFNAGIAVCATGHCHPLVVEAIKKQASNLIHMSGTDYYYPLQTELAEKLVEITPGGMNKRVFFCNSGAEAVEGAFKLARYATERKNVIAFYGAFHGRTMGALSLTASKAVQKQKFGPLIAGVYHVPYAYCYRCAYHLEYPGCDFACINYIEDYLFKKVVPGEEVAAIFVEPIQGEGGYVVPPPGYFNKLRALCDKYGILLIADEVQSGMGRTGKMFALEHWEVMADIYCVAKGIASGLPLGAFIANAGLMNWPAGTHASTFGGNPVACASALATIKLLEDGLIDNACKMGELILNRLEALQAKYQFIGDIRGKGLMVAMELVEDSISKRPIPEKRNSIVYQCFERGLLLQGCGESAIRFSPPLIVNEEEVNVAMDILESVLAGITVK